MIGNKTFFKQTSLCILCVWQILFLLVLDVLRNSWLSKNTLSFIKIGRKSQFVSNCYNVMCTMIVSICKGKTTMSHIWWGCPDVRSDFLTNQACCNWKAAIMGGIVDKEITWCCAKVYPCCCLSSVVTPSLSLGKQHF